QVDDLRAPGFIGRADRRPDRGDAAPLDQHAGAARREPAADEHRAVGEQDALVHCTSSAVLCGVSTPLDIAIVNTYDYGSDALDFRCNQAETRSGRGCSR